MAGRLSCNIKYVILSLLLVCTLSGPLFSQTKISGVINKYGRVTGIGADYVIVNDAAQFAQFLPGDTILLIQMKGVRIYTFEDGTYGTPVNKYGAPGAHEFLTILSVEPGTKKIIFRNNITQLFSVEGLVQIIKVPSYNYAQVDGLLTCQPWDSVTKTGGVLAAIVGRTLSLNANIDVTGKGFKGGVPVSGPGVCISTDGTLDQFSFPYSSNKAGSKGESPAIRSESAFFPLLYPQFALAKGANLTGGGGGNGKFSGGGGGGNYGFGGKGGRESATCSLPVDGGVAGKGVKNDPNLDPGIYLGGGGGGSTYTTGTPTGGGNGGGIIILLCDTLKGNSKSILANGASVTTTASGNAGAGGGGGGGSIAIYLGSYTTNATTAPITLSATGGKGGNYSGNSSVGGGGGGGFITTSPVSSSWLGKTVNPGAVGTQTSGTNYGTSGQTGDIRTNFVPRLNGFLFNSIRSSVSGTQVDSICSDVVPKLINGTTPVGGSGSYTYLWQKSYNPAGAKINIPGSNVKDYTPTALESDTVWFRRIVTDNVTVPTLSDTSKWVEIRVQTAISGNLVGKDTTICYNQDPLPLIPLNAGPSKGNGKYAYRWVQNETNTGWITSPDATGSPDYDSYDPPSLTGTTYFQRIVTSGRCVSYSSTVTITVLPLITGNSMARPDSVICEGMLFNTLSVSDAGGGDGTFKYLWQDSITTGTWTTAPNVNAGTAYTVDTSKFAVAEHRFFRRIVYSGPDSVCVSKSLPIHMTRYHYIENNSISKDTTICSGSVPPALTGTTPLKGSGTYTYIWQDSTRDVAWASRGTIMSPFGPPALTDTTWYRRIVNSSKCSDTSKVLIIKVHKPVTGNIASLLSGPGPDTTVCSSAVPHRIKGGQPDGGTDLPGDYAYMWFSSSDNFVSSNSAVASGGTLRDYQPGALTETTWFRRKVISGKCETYSNAIRVIVLPPVTNNLISSTQAKVCYGTVPPAISGTPLTGGDSGILTWLWQQSTDGATWSTATGASSQQNYTPPALNIPTKYRRIILSGLYNCCQDTSNVLEIGIFPLPTGSLTNVADTTICDGSAVQLKIRLTGASPWTVTYLENTTGIAVNNINGTDYIISRVPVASASVSTFNYSYSSITDNNGCIATATLMTGGKKATVYRVPRAFAGDDEEVCGPEYQLKAVPTDGTGKWTWEAAAPVIVPYPVAYNDKVKIDVSTITGANSTWEFYWEEKNWQCVSKDAVKITFSNPVEPVCAGNDTTIYSFDYLIQVRATPLQTWETGLWSVIEGNGEFDDNTKNETTVRNISEGTNKFNWKVTNGKCSSEAQQIISILNLKIPEGFSPNNDPGGFNNTFIIKGLDLRTNPDGTPAFQLAELKIISGSGTQVFETSNDNGNEWKEWDGKDTNGTDLPEGTYYYLLKITSIEVPGQVFRKSGFIILKRY